MERTIYLGIAGETHLYIAEHVYSHTICICLDVFTVGRIDRFHRHVKKRKDKDNMRFYK